MGPLATMAVATPLILYLQLHYMVFIVIFVMMIGVKDLTLYMMELVARIMELSGIFGITVLTIFVGIILRFIKVQRSRTSLQC
jgi:hypothetical protein